MLAFLKSIFGGRSAAPQGNVGLAIPRTVYTPQPQSGTSHRSRTKAGRTAQKAAPTPEPEPAPTPAPAQDSDNSAGSDIDISLQAVLRGLPADIKDRVIDLDIRGATMTISLERILAQLPSGSVKISFGSLRHAAPQLFSAGAEFDSRDVALPLDEILAKVNPAMICRPEEPVQRIDGPVAQPERRAESEASTAVEAEPPAEQRASSLSVPPISPPGETTKPVSTESTPSRRMSKRAEKAARRRVQPPQPAKTKEPEKSVAEATAEQKSNREEIPDLFFDARKAEHPGSENGHDAAGPAQAAPVAPQPEVAESQNFAEAKAASAPTTGPAQSVAEQSVMRIALKELTALWPENVRAEVAHWNLDQMMVALPAEKINSALKQGKVIFPWENLRAWILPAPPTATALQDSALLELPLPIIMPLFLAARKQDSKSVAKAQPQIADDIPDPFADFLPSAATDRNRAESPNIRIAPTVEAARAATGTKKNAAFPTAPVVEKSSKANLPPQQAPAVEPVQAAEKAQAEPVQNSKAATPAEVLATAVNLEGVVGALVALADGFKVASKLPAGLDGDTLAAFLPHIFSKVNQSTRELRMGELNNLNFTVDNVPWKIFRVDQIFFAALGNAGKPMPTAQLAALAHQLTFKN